MTDQQDQGTSSNQPGTGQSDPQEQTEERLKRGQDPNQFFQTAKEELKSDRPRRPQTGDNARPDLAVQGYSFGSFESGQSAPAEAKAPPAKQPGFFDDHGNPPPGGGSGSGAGSSGNIQTDSIIGTASALAGGAGSSGSASGGGSAGSHSPSTQTSAHAPSVQQTPSAQPPSGKSPYAESPRVSSTGLTSTQSQFFDEPMDPSKVQAQPPLPRQSSSDGAAADPRISHQAETYDDPTQGASSVDAQRQIAGYFPDAGSETVREPYESPKAPSVEFDDDEDNDEEYEVRRPTNRTNEDSRGRNRLPIIDSRPEKEAPRRKEPPPKRHDEQEQSVDYLYDEEVEEKKKRDKDDRKMQARSDRFNRLEKLVTPETKSILTYALLQAKEILLSPKTFFVNLPESDDVGEAAMFLFICAAAGGLLAGFINFNLLVTPGFFFCNVITTFLIAAIMTKVIPKAFDKASFASIFRIVAYSQAACFLIAGLKLGPFGLLTLIPATIYSIKLQLMGFETRMNVPRSVVMAPLIGTTLFLLIVRWKLGCL
jgi:Uncharacterized protein conserved in archaea